MTQAPEFEPAQGREPSFDEATLSRLQRMADAAHAFSIWRSATLDQTPVIELSAWRVMELGNGRRHLVGTNLTEGGSGRVSSAIVGFTCPGDSVNQSNDLTAVVSTSTGRAYQLVGSPGRSDDSDYVWRRWLNGVGSPEWAEVSETVLGELQPKPSADK